MDTWEQDDLSTLAEKIEVLRKKLHAALDVAGGNQQDPTVLKASEEFDQAMNRLMRLQSQSKNGHGPSQAG